MPSAGRSCPGGRQLVGLGVASSPSDRVANGGEVGTYLVGPAGLQPARHQGTRAGVKHERALGPVASAGLAAALDHRHLDPAAGERPRRGLDQTLVRLELAMDARPGSAARRTGPPAGDQPLAGRRVRATTSKPDVPLSSRWTIPGRSSSGPPRRCRESGPRAAAPASPDGYPLPGGPPDRPACPPRRGGRRRRRWWRRAAVGAAGPGRSRSSGHAGGPDGARSTSSSSPARSRRLPARTAAPPTRAPPSATRREAWARLRPTSRARPRSTRSPSRAVGTDSSIVPPGAPASQVPLGVTLVPVGACRPSSRSPPAASPPRKGSGTPPRCRADEKDQAHRHGHRRPTVMAASATLKIGHQLTSWMKSTTAPWWWRNKPVGQVGHGATGEQAQSHHDRPGSPRPWPGAGSRTTTATTRPTASASITGEAPLPKEKAAPLVVGERKVSRPEHVPGHVQS